MSSITPQAQIQPRRVVARRARNGMVLIVMLGLLAVVSVFGSIFPGLMGVEAALAKRFALRTRLYYAARAGLETACWTLARDTNAYDSLREGWKTDPLLGSAAPAPLEVTVVCYAIDELDAAADGSPADLPVQAGLMRLAQSVQALSGEPLNINVCSVAAAARRLGDERAAATLIGIRRGPDGLDNTEDDRPFTSSSALLAAAGNLEPEMVRRNLTVQSKRYFVVATGRMTSGRKQRLQRRLGALVEKSTGGVRIQYCAEP